MVCRTADRAFFVRIEEIDFFEADGNYVKVHAQNTVHRMRVTLRDLMDRIDPIQFTRIHKSTIVNIARIREVQPWFGGDHLAILNDGRKLRVSRTYARDLLRPMR